MAISFEGTFVPDTLPALPCGGVPYFDHDSGYAYRCDACLAVIGSVGMPVKCFEAYEASKASISESEKNIVKQHTPEKRHFHKPY